MSVSLELKNISKVYPGVIALDKVSLSFEKGEVHSIMGENGAGKSTLIKVVAGAIEPSEGTIIVGGKEYSKMTPALSRENGIGVIYQEFTLVPTLSVADNIFLGERVGKGRLVNDSEMHRRSAEIFEQFNMKIDTHALVGKLSTAQQQLVEIAKAISKNVKILIMDEPSATLALAEVELMFKIVRKLKEQGITIIYISHRIDEIFEISDRVSIMRDGQYVATKKIEDVTRKEIVNLMVGRELNETCPKRNVKIGEPLLECRNICGNGDYGIDLTLRRGEIVGLAGLVGAGRTEFAKMLYGAVPMMSGDVLVDGKKLQLKSPSDAIENGIGLIPEDRKTEGAFLTFPIDWNIALMSIRKYSKHGVVQKNKLKELSDYYFKMLKIKAFSGGQLVANLSGGNQQKVVLAKTLAANTRIIIFDEPTRGIDVGAKQEIYKLMNSLVEAGNAILMITSDMEELLGMSDRILVMSEGVLAGELQKNEFSQSRVLELASGI